MKYLILVLLFASLFTNAQDMKIQKKYVSDTIKVNKDTLKLKDFNQKPDAFYIQQNHLKSQIYNQNTKIEEIILQKSYPATKKRNFK